MKVKFGIIAILLIALFFRVYRLDNLPVSMFGDEVDASYHGWSLATTLRDYRGHFLPSYIQSFAEWRAPLEMYVIAPFIGILGPSNFSARLPMALLGVLSVYLIYLIVEILFPSKEKYIKPSFIAALILAITPWHIFYTRTVVEQPPLFALILLGVYFYLKGKDKNIYYPVSLFFFILTFYTYSIANLATPFIILSLLICFPPKLKVLLQKQTLVGFFVCFIAVLPITYQIIFGQAAGRFRLINIANDKQTLDQIIFDRNRPWISNQFAEKIFNNRLTAIGGVFLKNYLTALSPQFMFISGDPIYRQSVDQFGVFLLVLAPFYFYGLYLVVKNISNRKFLFLLLWLLLIPIGSSLTQGGGNHASRLFLMIFPVTVITCLGLVELFSLFGEKKRATLVTIALIGLAANISAYWYRYTNHYAYESSHVWQYGYEPLFVRSRDLIANAKRVFINNNAEPVLYRMAFFLPIHPQVFLKDFRTDELTKNIVPGFDGYKFGDKFYLGTAGDFEGIKKLLQPGDIYLASQRMDIPGAWDLEKNPPPEIKVLLTIRDFYGQPLFYVLSK